MRQKKEKLSHKRGFTIFKRKRFILILTAVLIGCLFIAYKPSQWWRFSPAEQITQPPLVHRNLVFTATNHGTITALDRRTGKMKWEFQREKEIIAGPKVQYGKLYIGYNDGVIVSLDAFSGEQRWIYQTENNKLLQTDLILNQTKLFFADSSGMIRAISLSTGKKIWEVETPTPESVDQVLTKDGLIWFGALMIDRGTLYAVKTQGYVIAISAENGKKQWDKTLDGTVISDPFITRTSLIISTSNRPVIALLRKSGEVKESEPFQGEQDLTYCQSDYYPKGILRELAQKTNLKFPVHLFTQESEMGQEVIQITRKGIVRGFNRNSLNLAWSLTLPFTPKRCFFDQDQSVYVASEQGELVKINLKTHALSWQKKMENELLFISSIRKHQSFRQEQQRIHYLTEYLFISDNTGKVSRVNPSSGEIKWTLQADGEVYVPPVLSGSNLFIVSTNGGLYRLDPHSGKPNVFTFFSPRIRWDSNTNTVQKGQIYELSLHTASDRYVNPYTEVDISAEFIDESGKTHKVNGFYYDSNIWKVRFNPPSSGKWAWKVVWKDIFQQKEMTGEFQSSRDYTFLHTVPEHPRWMTRNGKTIASFVGLNDCISDWNKNGYPLDDFYLKEGSQKVATLSGTVPQTFAFNTSLVSLNSFLENYKPGFNLFRQSVSNCSPSLFDSEKFTYSKYLTQEGKIHDEISQSLFKQGYTVWFTFFGFSLPFGELKYPDEKVAMENYIKYVVARYGAYVDIWEMSNEAVISEEYTKVVADLLQKYDSYDRLLSVSWEKPQMQEITLSAPHWYETESDGDSDIALISHIEELKTYPKPIFFGEQGNKTRNWDPTSAQRMRVRIWTGFFNQAFLSFWNQTHDKNFYNPTLQNSNIYIAEEEIKYTKTFLNITDGLPIDLTPASSSLPPSEVRSYKLENAEISLEYFFNSSLEEKTVSVPISGSFISPIKAEWIDPKTADVLKEEEVLPGQATASPIFSVDILLRIKKL